MLLNPPTKDKRLYEHLLSQVAAWKPSSDVLPPEELYRQLKELSDRLTRANHKLSPWAINLEGFFLLKAGRAFRNSQSHRLGPLWSIVRNHSKHAIVARWILARVEVGEVTAVNPIEANRHLRRAHKLIRKIIDPVKELKVDILLPGIRSETSYLVKDEWQLGSGDLPIHFIPVPYRYQVSYAVNRANLIGVARPFKAVGLLDYGLDLCQLAAKRVEDKSSQYALNIQLSKLVIQSMKECLVHGSTQAHTTIDQFYEFIEITESQISEPQKAYEWVTACYAGIASLTRGAIHKEALAKLLHYARKTYEANEGRVDFFAIDTIYKNAFKGDEDRDELSEFALLIRPPRVIEPSVNYKTPPVSKLKTAFASYASADRDRVLDRVASIRINSGLDVFVDCLSLCPSDLWKPRLEREIKSRDVFLLFWSKQAASSRWVEWEWQTALRERGRAAIQIHPLELGPTPPDLLQDIHFGDPIMAVREAEIMRIRK